MANTAIHSIDLAHWFLAVLSSLPRRVCRTARYPHLPSSSVPGQSPLAEYDVEDLTSGYARFAGGQAMTIESMWLAPPQVDGIGVDVWGTHGFASLMPLRLITWQDGDYVERTEEIAPGLAESFVDDSQVRALREMEHFGDCACTAAARPYAALSVSQRPLQEPGTRSVGAALPIVGDGSPHHRRRGKALAVPGEGVIPAPPALPRTIADTFLIPSSPACPLPHPPA